MGLKEIKTRINAIKKTAEITQAMHNIALSKIRSATKTLRDADIFVQDIRRIIDAADRSAEEHRMTSPHEGDHTLYVLVTSDRGLAGSYHNQLFKAFLEDVKDIPDGRYQLVVLGKKGYYFAKKRRLPLVNTDIVFNRDDITAIDFKGYARLIGDAFRDGLCDRVVLMFSHYVNTATQTIATETILPYIPKNPPLREEYIYDADPSEVLDNTVLIHVEGSIYRALADAKLSEHASRMIAMKNATDNAKDIVERLTMEYHRARQQEITSEIIDVVNGSNN